MTEDVKVEPISIYLAGAIDAVTVDEAMDWRLEAARAMPEMVVCFNPVTAYTIPNQAAAREINRLNRVVLTQVDGVLVNLEHEGAFGTIREIEFASNRSTPVAVFGRDLSVHYMAQDLILAENTEDAITKLLAEIMKRRDMPTGWFPFPVIRLSGPTEETPD